MNEAWTGRRLDGGEIVRAARGWIGTPYHDQASVKGAGTDCLGLVRGVWRELIGEEPEAAPSYSRDWAEASGRETMLEASRRHMRDVDPRAARPGDVLLFRIRPDAVVKHAAILASEGTMVHAMEGRKVAEVVLVPWWRRRIAAAFRLPGVE